ncbi:GntR family transcriptional regulator [Paenibacillaceae bacterium]|nr:GntR family transcriptional regulator [Paenibacillaceae bacterium]
MNTDLPLYAQIQSYIQNKIKTGEWPPGSRIPSERLLAEHFGVSRITAKNAIVGLVHSSVLYRHRGKGTFVAVQSDTAQPDGGPMPSGGGSNISSISARLDSGSSQEAPRSKLIGFVIPWLEFHYSSLLLAGVENELSRHGCCLVFKRTTDRQSEDEALRELLALPVDGLIIVPNQDGHLSDEIVRLILDRYPVVLVEKTARDLRANGVCCDTGEVGALMAGYLLEQGCEQIGLVTYPAAFTFGVKERMYGFQSALLNKAVRPLPPECIAYVPNQVLARQLDEDASEVPSEIVELLNRNPQLQAIAAADALLAHYVGRECAARGRTDILIVCVDEPTVRPRSVPPAAYINQHPLQMGRSAARLLVASMREPGEPREIIISPTVVD